MSNLSVIQTKDKMYFGTDSAISTKINDKYYRISEDGKKIFIIDNKIIFCSGNLDLSYEIIEKYSKEQHKSIDTLKEIAKELYSKYIFDEDEFILDIVVGEVFDDYSVTYQISPYDNFEIKKNIIDNGIYILSGGIRTQESLEILQNLLSRSNNICGIYQSLFDEISFEGIGGKLSLYKIDKDNINLLYSNDIKEKDLTVLDLNSLNDYAKHLIIGERIIGTLLMGTELVMTNQNADFTFDENGVTLKNTGITIVGGLPASEIDTTVVTNASNGATAYSGTTQYRTTGVPTNNPSPTGITITTNTNATINIQLSWGAYTQGAKQADFILLFWKKGTGTPTVNDSSLAFNANTSGTSYYIFEGINPADTYSFGIASARRTESGLEIGAIQSPTATPDWQGVTSGTPNYTGNINSTSAATVVTNAANGASAWGKFSGTGNTLPSGNVEFNFANSTTKGGNATNTDAVGTQSATTVQNATINFNNRNDRNSTAITNPTIASDGTAVDHTIATDGSANISFEWSWSGTNADIDSWIVYVYQSTSSSAYTFGTTSSAEQVFYLTPDKRAFILYGCPADQYYTFGIKAIRIVDSDVNATGIISSSIVKPSLAAENPYRPSSSITFGGDITGTINGIAASTVLTNITNAQSDANTANVEISNMSSDDKISPVEKLALKKDWDTIVAEKSILDTQADTYGITTEKTNYDNAYTALNTYLNTTKTVFANMSTTTDLGAGGGATLRTNFSNYYTAKINLLNKINDVTKAVADTVNTNTSTYQNTSAPNGTFTCNTISNTANTDGSANITLSWSYTPGSVRADGYVVVYETGNSSPTTVPTTASVGFYQDTTTTGFTMPGVPANKYHSFKIYAYRNTNLGVVVSSLTNHATWLNYQPSSSVSFNGNVTGSVDGKTVNTINIIAPSNIGNGSDGAFNSVGNVTFSVTEDEGPVVKQYTSFTLNAGHTMTVDNRCKGLIIYCQGDVTIDGTISMDDKAARVTRNVDSLPWVQSCAKINYFDYTARTLVDFLLPAGGSGGSGGTSGSAKYGSEHSDYPNGGNGYAGGSNCSYGGSGGGGGASGMVATSVTQIGTSVGGSAGGVGGGAGGTGGTIGGSYATPGANGGSGGGGIIVIIAKGNITINSGGVVSAKSSQNGGNGGNGSGVTSNVCSGGGGGGAGNGGGGENGYFNPAWSGIAGAAGGGGGGGGAGGGIVVLMYGGTYTNDGSINVNGSNGGSGGNGSGYVNSNNYGNNGENGSAGTVGSIFTVKAVTSYV